MNTRSSKRKTQSDSKSGLLLLLWVGLVLLGLGLIIARIQVPEMLWLTVVLGTLLAGDFGLLVYEHRKALTGRTAAFGLNSFVTILLVLGLLGLANFLAIRYPFKLDLTQNKRNTLADQSIKILKNLKKPIQATYFGSLQEKEKIRPLLENYQGTTREFQLEYADPVKDILRSQKEGITRRGQSIDTLVLRTDDRASKVENPTEEKITNALIKLIKEKRQTICNVSGHGERDFNQSNQDGYEAVRKGLDSQGYAVRELNLTQQASVPADCDAIAIVGPNKAFFEPEIKAINTYLDGGGRAMIALDPVLEGRDNLKEIKSVIEGWHIKPKDEIVLDAVGASITQDLAVIISKTHSKDHVITKDQNVENYFVATRPLEANPNTPAGINIQWLLKSLPTAWGEADLDAIKKGKLKNRADPTKGGLVLGFAVEGKRPDSKAVKNTRLVVFGTSAFATNGNSRFGGNLDLFLNSASWVLEDESLISIRPKEEGTAKFMMSYKTFLMICLVTIVLMPLGITISGIVIWLRRRKL